MKKTFLVLLIPAFCLLTFLFCNEASGYPTTIYIKTVLSTKVKTPAGATTWSKDQNDVYFKLYQLPEARNKPAETIRFKTYLVNNDGAKIPVTDDYNAFSDNIYTPIWPSPSWGGWKNIKRAIIETQPDSSSYTLITIEVPLNNDKPAGYLDYRAFFFRYPVVPVYIYAYDAAKSSSDDPNLLKIVNPYGTETYKSVWNDVIISNKEGQSKYKLLFTAKATFKNRRTGTTTTVAADYIPSQPAANGRIVFCPEAKEYQSLPIYVGVDYDVTVSAPGYSSRTFTLEMKHEKEGVLLNYGILVGLSPSKPTTPK